MLLTSVEVYFETISLSISAEDIIWITQPYSDLLVGKMESPEIYAHSESLETNLHALQREQQPETGSYLCSA